MMVLTTAIRIAKVDTSKPEDQPARILMDSMGKDFCMMASIAAAFGISALVRHDPIVNVIVH